MLFTKPYEKPGTELLVVRFEQDLLGGTYNASMNEKLVTVNEEEDFE